MPQGDAKEDDSVERARDALLVALGSGTVREGRPVRLDSLAPLGDHPWSTVYAGRERETGRPLVVKAVKRRAADAGAHLDREWRVLRALMRARDAGDLSAGLAPDAIALFEDPPAIVLSRVSHRTLQASMTASVRFPGRLFRFGRLLREFGEATRSLAEVTGVLSKGPPVVDTPGPALEEIMKSRFAGGGRDRGLGESVLALAMELGLEMPEGGFKHGNFAPWNVLSGPEGAAIIDFQGAEQPGTWLDDIAQMMIHLEIAGELGGLRPGQVHALCRSIFRSATDAADVHSLPRPDGGGLRTRYLYELCRMHSWYVTPSPEAGRMNLPARALATGNLLRRRVASGGRSMPWR